MNKKAIIIVLFALFAPPAILFPAIAIYLLVKLIIKIRKRVLANKESRSENEDI